MRTPHAAVDNSAAAAVAMEKKLAAAEKAKEEAERKFAALILENRKKEQNEAAARREQEEAAAHQARSVLYIFLLPVSVVGSCFSNLVLTLYYGTMEHTIVVCAFVAVCAVLQKYSI